MPSIFKSTVEKYKSLKYLNGDYSSTDDTSIGRLKLEWDAKVTPLMSQRENLVDENAEPCEVREPLESAESRREPYHNYIQDHKRVDDVTFNSDADLCGLYFEKLRERMPNFSEHLS